MEVTDVESTTESPPTLRGFLRHEWFLGYDPPDPPDPPVRYLIVYLSSVRHTRPFIIHASSVDPIPSVDGPSTILAFGHAALLGRVSLLQHELRPLLLLELHAFNLHVFTHHVRKPEVGASHVLFEVCGLGSDAVALDLEFLPGVLDGFAGEAAGETVGGAIAIAVMLSVSR
jgi:hypothetical protein